LGGNWCARTIYSRNSVVEYLWVALIGYGANRHVALGAATRASQTERELHRR
jgi:hypothetical protein